MSGSASKFALLVLLALLASAQPARAVDVDGTWTGTMYGGKDERRLIVVLESSGTLVTGTYILHPEDVNDAVRRWGLAGVVGRRTVDDMPRVPIVNGKVDDEVLVFDVESELVVAHFELLAVDENELVGTVTRTTKVPSPNRAWQELDERLARGRVRLRRTEQPPPAEAPRVPNRSVP